MSRWGAGRAAGCRLAALVGLACGGTLLQGPQGLWPQRRSQRRHVLLLLRKRHPRSRSRLAGPRITYPPSTPAKPVSLPHPPTQLESKSAEVRRLLERLRAKGAALAEAAKSAEAHKQRAEDLRAFVEVCGPGGMRLSCCWSSALSREAG
jgi:hypothetical protein